MTNYKLSGDNKGESLVVIYDGEDPVTVPGTHPKFDEILTLLRGGEAYDDEVEALVNENHAMARKLSNVTERVSVTPYAAFFDGDPLNPAMTSVILDLYNEGKEEGLKAVANFLDKASQNISMDSVEALYQWIRNGDLVLKSNGNFVAYKGVQTLGGEVVSISSGTAWVDGVRHRGHIPNPVGAVISMPRSKVNADGKVGCSTGLHAGTYSYASGFGRGILLLVEINPRDVVSVPDDFTFAKLRVSRYTVLEHIDGRLDTRLYPEAEEEYDWKDDGDFAEDDPVDESNIKGRVFYGDNVVDDITPTIADLWFKSYGNPCRWDGEDWVEVQSESVTPLDVSKMVAMDITADSIAARDTLQGTLVLDGSIKVASVLHRDIEKQIGDVVNKTIEDNFGKRGPDGKFVKGGTVKMQRDEKGHFISDKKAKKKAKKAKKKGENK